MNFIPVTFLSDEDGDVRQGMLHSFVDVNSIGIVGMVFDDNGKLHRVPFKAIRAKPGFAFAVNG